MFDFPFESFSIYTSLYCLLVWSLLVISNYKKGLIEIASESEPVNYRNLLLTIALFFVTHAIVGDFFHLQEYVLYHYPRGLVHQEEVYGYIAGFTNYNYFLFRIIVWGSAFAIFCWTSKRFGAPVYQSVIFLLATHAITFGYARVTLAMSIYYLGVSFICNPPKNKLLIGYVTGIILICCSSIFHTSAFVMIAATLMLLVPLKKWTVILLLASLPVSILALKILFNYAVFTIGSEAVASKMIMYSERKTGNSGIAAIIISFFEFASFYVPMLAATLCLFTKETYKRVSTGIIPLFKISLGLIFVATVFLFAGNNFYIFFYRTLFMSMIPLSIMLTKLYQDGLLTKGWFKISFIFGMIFCCLRYMHDLRISAVWS